MPTWATQQAHWGSRGLAGLAPGGPRGEAGVEGVHVAAEGARLARAKLSHGFGSSGRAAAAWS